jgi:hypothetical protein
MRKTVMKPMTDEEIDKTVQALFSPLLDRCTCPKCVKRREDRATLTQPASASSQAMPTQSNVMPKPEKPKTSIEVKNKAHELLMVMIGSPRFMPDPNKIVDAAESCLQAAIAIYA